MLEALDEFSYDRDFTENWVVCLLHNGHVNVVLLIRSNYIVLTVGVHRLVFDVQDTIVRKEQNLQLNDNAVL